MDTNKQECEKCRQILQDTLVRWKTAKDRIEYVREASNKAVTSLYWMNVKMNNYRQGFQQEQIEQVDLLSSEFSELADVYDDVLTYLEEQQFFIQNAMELYDGKGMWNCSEDDMMKFMQRYKVCQSKLQFCNLKEQQVIRSIEALKVSLEHDNEEMQGMRWKGIYRGIGKIYRNIADFFK